MTAHQRIVRVRRNYNTWVANQTLEDYALRFTAKSARKWSSLRVANTAIGAISFLALEAIGGAITVNYGFANATGAILAVGGLIFLTGLPIAYYAATYGVDIDLLTRGAGFGYIGSTVTSLIYASFTFLFFAIEAAIMSLALELWFHVPLFLGYIVSSVVVIPLVTHGITFISRLQLWTQPIWLVLHILPFVFIAMSDAGSFEGWTHYGGRAGAEGQSFNLLMFGAASTVVFSLIAQIGEQVDFLRFLPPRSAGRPVAWWTAFLAAGPGWIVPGLLKLLAGSFLAYLAVRHFVPVEKASEPTQMYLVAFQSVFSSPAARARLHLHLRHHFADQDQRDQRLCGLDRVVEFLLAAHPQPSRARGLAGVQCGDRIAADGARNFPGPRAHSRAVFDRRGGLGRSPGRRPRRQQAAGIEPALHRIQARPPLRHQSGRRRRDDPRDRGRDTRPLRRARRHPAGARELPRPGDRFRRGARHRLRHRRQILSGAKAVEVPGRVHGALLHLRDRLRARGHGAMSGLFRPDLLAVLFARNPLPRLLQAGGEARQPARRLARAHPAGGGSSKR